MLARVSVLVCPFLVHQRARLQVTWLAVLLDASAAGAIEAQAGGGQGVEVGGIYSTAAMPVVVPTAVRASNSGRLPNFAVQLDVFKLQCVGARASFSSGCFQIFPAVVNFVFKSCSTA